MLAGVSATGVSAITGAAPKTVAATGLFTPRVETGTLSALCYGKAGTTNMVLKAQWQVSFQGSAWYNCFDSNYTAQGTLASQAGTSPATVILTAPPSVYGMPYARCIVTSSGATGAGLGTDEASVSYNYRATYDNQRGRQKAEGASLGTLPITGSAGTTLSGGTLATSLIQPGTMGALVYGLATTSGMVLSGRWQGSNNATTWYDVRTAANASLTTLASQAGTIFALGAISAPDGIYSFRFARYAITTSGATGGGAGVDEYALAYHYRKL